MYHLLFYLSFLAFSSRLARCQPQPSNAAAPSNTLICTQPRPTDSGTPSGEDVLGQLESFDMNGFCGATGQGGVALRIFEGWAVWGFSNSLTARDNNTCQQAIGDIFLQCVNLNGTYGGTAIINGQGYNVSSLVFPNNPLTEGPAAANPPPAVPSHPAPPNTIPEPSCSDFSLQDLNSGAVFQQAGGEQALGTLLSQGPFDSDKQSLNRIDIVASNIFGGPANFRCGIQESGCNVIEHCEDVSSPGAYMVLNSFANFQSVRDSDHHVERRSQPIYRSSTLCKVVC